MGLYGTCDLPSGVQAQSPKHPTILRYLKSKNSYFWTVLYQVSNPK